MEIRNKKYENHDIGQYAKSIVPCDQKFLKMNDAQEKVWAYRDAHHLLFQSPCGSGKTKAQIWLAIHDVMSSNFLRRQLILTPQRHIGMPFAKADLMYENREVSWHVGKNLCDESSVDELEDFLLSNPEKLAETHRQPNYITGVVCIATHFAFAKVWQRLESKPTLQLQALDRLTLRPDEAQHIKNAYSSEEIEDLHILRQAAMKESSTWLGKACRFAAENSPSTKIHGTTATFYRGDQEFIFTPSLMDKMDMKVCTYSWVDFWKTTGIEEIFINYVTYEQNPIKLLVQSIVGEKNERHLIILPRRGKLFRQNETTSQIIKLLMLNGYKEDEILDVTKSHHRNQINDPKIKVIISCAIFNEGTDWPPCSRIHNLDCERSAMLAVQRMGRGMRRYLNKRTLAITYYVYETKEPNRDNFTRHLTTLAIGMHMDDLFDPEELPRLHSKFEQLGQEESDSVNNTLSDLFGGRHQEAYQELIIRAEAATDVNQIQNVIRSIVDDFAIEELDENMVKAAIIALNRRLIKSLPKITFPTVNIDEIKKQWENVIANKDGSLFFGKLTLENMGVLKTIIESNKDAFFVEMVSKCKLLGQEELMKSNTRESRWFRRWREDQLQRNGECNA